MKIEPVTPEGEVEVIVARFHTDNLTEGHLQLLESIHSRHEKIIVLLGISPLMSTRYNPLDFQTRKMMVEEAYPEAIVLYIDDANNNEIWSRNLDRQINSVAKGQRAVLYGSRDSFIPAYKGRFPTVEMGVSTNISATEIRRKIAAKPRNSADFRRGVISAVYNQFPTVYSTVDVAVLNEDGTQVIAGRKEHETGLRFPGGFTDVASDSDEEDAKREVMEETSVEVADFRYLFSMRMHDWRYRNEVDCVRTHMFIAKHIFGKPTPGDDLAACYWAKIEDLEPEQFVEGHSELFKRFLTYL